MKQFIPLTDELIFDHPELLAEPCVPFSLDYECYRWLNSTPAKHKSHKSQAVQGEVT